MKTNYKNGGYDRKYIIQKTDGSPINPKAEYFVLRIDKDPYALASLIHYAMKVMATNRQLSEDLFNLCIQYKLMEHATEDEKIMIENKIIQFKLKWESR